MRLIILLAVSLGIVACQLSPSDVKGLSGTWGWQDASTATTSSFSFKLDGTGVWLVNSPNFQLADCLVYEETADGVTVSFDEGKEVWHLERDKTSNALLWTDEDEAPLRFEPVGNEP